MIFSKIINHDKDFLAIKKFKIRILTDTNSVDWLLNGKSQIVDELFISEVDLIWSMYKTNLSSIQESLSLFIFINVIW